ncbi:hypothetical protein [Streptomyces himalayensis]|uniref:Peptidase M10 metallopeptidase domain-containing protein n=1 Tax=Streptomyces himalayensis subsp. himalayensis TaxID=2756131 RepID=A0A7W0DS89_9ACTN|nr:hypothetical protein [Streptomyces himalayensis]MBA2949813.1 hypothetical protein [Streptomyces himalayensis subsp. himalayensis]
MSQIKRILWTVTAGAMIAALCTPAYAGHDNEGTDPDNRNQAVKGFNLTAKGQGAMEWGKTQLERSVITTSWGGGDIEVHDYTTSGVTWAGQTRCKEWNALWTSCDVITIQFNTYWKFSDWEWLVIGCHEMGHTGDLGHRSASNDTDDNSCMRGSTGSAYYKFDAHDLNAIAAGT